MEFCTQQSILFKVTHKYLEAPVRWGVGEMDNPLVIFIPVYIGTGRDGGQNQQAHLAGQQCCYV